MADIRFDNLSKSYGEVSVIPSMELTIRDGEFFTFVGPSGCGKSTILNMIAGLEERSGGRILFDGEPIDHLSPGERDVAVVFQSYALYPHMSVRENLAFPLRMKKRGKREIAAEVERVAALLGIAELLGRKPAQLSGGQRQRVALGRAIIRRPRAFLMDEPLSNLDAQLRVEMRGELKRLHRELGITTIYVTHDQSEALGLSERIAVLNRGFVEQCGEPAEIYARPANLFVARFIGSPPINIVPAKILRPIPLEVECNGVILSPEAESSPKGESVLLGVRPEDLDVSGEPSSGAFEVVVSVVEPAGHRNWVEADWKGVRIRGAASPSAGLKAGQMGFASLNSKGVLVFDPESGRRT
jgi:multiple sugar transport system ATP-binding protein